MAENKVLKLMINIVPLRNIIWSATRFYLGAFTLYIFISDLFLILIDIGIASYTDNTLIVLIDIEIVSYADNTPYCSY